MAWIALALGLSLAVEGLVLALAPSRIEEALEMLRRMTPETRRMIGLACLAAGVGLVALGRWLGV